MLLWGLPFEAYSDRCPMVGHMIRWIDLIIGGKATFSRIFVWEKIKRNLWI